MTRASLIMYGVAGVSALAGGFVATRPAADEAAIYRRRIAAAMLGAFALLLGGFATAAQLAGSRL